MSLLNNIILINEVKVFSLLKYFLAFKRYIIKTIFNFL